MIIGPNTTISDRYRIESLIATGGMGQVWLARDTVLDRDVAIKILKSEFSADPNFLSRFREEARTTARLNHPNIVSVFDYGEFEDTDGGDNVAYLVMELVHAESLSHALGRLEKLTVAQALDMLSQTAQGLSAAHEEGIVHRDIKPGNILITPRGRVKISDFGIAKAVDSVPITATGTVMGTAQYISPEQAIGKEATSASDVYSLGIVGYEAIAGKRPFDGEGSVTAAMQHVTASPNPLPPDIPANVRNLIAIALRKDPKARYKDGSEFAKAVSQVQAGNPAPLPASVKAGNAGIDADDMRKELQKAVNSAAEISGETPEKPLQPGSMAGVKGVAGAAGAMGASDGRDPGSAQLRTYAIPSQQKQTPRTNLPGGVPPGAAAGAGAVAGAGMAAGMAAGTPGTAAGSAGRPVGSAGGPGSPGGGPIGGGPFPHDAPRRVEEPEQPKGLTAPKIILIIVGILAIIGAIAYVAYVAMGSSNLPTNQPTITRTHTTTLQNRDDDRDDDERSAEATTEKPQPITTTKTSTKTKTKTKTSTASNPSTVTVTSTDTNTEEPTDTSTPTETILDPTTEATSNVDYVNSGVEITQIEPTPLPDIRHNRTRRD